MGAINEKNINILNEQYELIKPLYPEVKMSNDFNQIFGFTSALEFEKQAIINPIKYLNGLIKLLKRKQCSLYENSQVTKIKKLDIGYVVTINNEVQIYTKKIIMACHYPFLLQNLYFTKMYQSSSYAVAFQSNLPISANYITLDKPYYYLRRYAKNIFIIGGSDHFTGTSIDINTCYNELLNKIKSLDLNAIILNKWFTEDCMPINYLPYVQTFSRYHQNIILVAGFQKWGFTNAHTAAVKVCELLKNNKYQPNSLTLIKNLKSYLRMVAQSVNGLLISKLLIKKNGLETINIDSGKAIKYQGMNVLVYRASKKEFFIFKNKCTHMGCSLTWNDVDKVWISKCHGTIYDKYGHIIYGPGIKNLEKLN